MEKEQIKKLLTKELEEGLIKEDESLKKYTSFKIGGKADFFIKIKTEETLQKVMKIIKENSIPFTVLGNGTNVLVKDNGVRGIVLKIELEEMQLQKETEYAKVTVGAGVKNAILAQKLCKEEIAGFEFMAGIPGTMGGAVYMNAGAYGKEIKELVQEVTYMELNGNLHTIPKEECKFEYRNSIFSQREVVITKVVLQLPYGNAKEIKQKMEEDMASRKAKQPLQSPSAGSSFKRGPDFITAKLIDDCGLKGYQIGGAQVSEKHAGFIINTGNATAKDVLDLVEYIQKVVFEKYQKKIELEIKVIGE